MKILHFSIIVTIVVTISAIIISILLTSLPQNQIPVYEYVIHEPYQGVYKNHGTVTIQNQTFHVANLDEMFQNKSGAEWVEMYNVNFSFPNGIEPENTPGGQIMESYVTFPDNPVPYRIAIGLGSSPNTPNYDYNTVLSTHKEPQAGFTVYNGTIQLLVNWPKIHSNVNIIGLNDTYRPGQPIDFRINANGFDNFNAGAIPDINITKSDGEVIWQNPHYIVMCCVGELTDYDKTFNFTNLNLKGPVVLNESGPYSVKISYYDKTVEKKFTVLPSNASSNLFYNGQITVSYSNGTHAYFPFNYTVTGYNKLLDSKIDNESRSIILSIQGVQDGNFTVTLSPKLVDFMEKGKKDSQFIVLEDGQEVDYKEYTYDENMIMTIHIPEGTKEIEIIPTEIV